MYEGNGRGSIQLFGANAENRATDFRGSTRMKLVVEKGWLCSGLRRFLLKAIKRDGIW